MTQSEKERKRIAWLMSNHKNRKTNIKDTEFYKENIDPNSNHIIQKGTPKTFLDLAAGYSPTLESKYYNSGEISGLHDIHSEDPAMTKKALQGILIGKTHAINMEKNPPEIVPIKYIDGIYGTYDDGSLRIIDYDRFRLTDRNMGFNDGVKYVAKDKPRYGSGEDERNKVLGKGEDNREPFFKAREFDAGIYDSNGKLLSKKDRQRFEIYRGDELGHVEYYKRRLRRGSPIESPFLSISGKKVSSHEGRHRSRALMEEGVTDMPIRTTENIPLKELKGQDHSLKEKHPDHALAFGIDRRVPIGTPDNFSMLKHIHK